MNDLKSDTIKTIRTIYEVLDKLDQVPEGEKKWEDTYEALNPSEIRKLLSEAEKGLEELCRNILLQNGEEQWSKPIYGLPVYLQQLKMANIISTQTMYKLDFFITSTVGHKSLDKLGLAREGVQELQRFVEENFVE